MKEWVNKHMSGIIVSATIAGAAGFLSDHYGAPVMLLAILIGMGFHFLLDDCSRCVPGIEFCAKRLLRLGVALMGIRVTLEQIFSLGAKPIIIIIICLFATIAFGYILVYLLRDKTIHKSTLGLLTGGAVAICGASAALAISLVLPKHKNSERDTLFTVITVTILSTIAMIFYPLLFKALNLSEETSALLIGATIHDVAQVVGAGFSISNNAGEIATYVKLLRVAMLPVVIVLLLFLFRGKGESQGRGAAISSFPWFAVGFVVILLANSTGYIPSSIQSLMAECSKWFLIIAISALGVKTSLKKIFDCGGAQIFVVVAETLFLLGLAIFLVKL